MNPKQRLTAAILGNEADRVPFSPFLAYYFQHLPSEIQAKGELDYLEKMGADPLMRGYGSAWRTECDSCSVESRQEGNSIYYRLSTPVGFLDYRSDYSAAGDTWFLAEHHVKTVEDLKILRYWFEHTKVVPEIENLNNAVSGLGDRALALPLLGISCKTAFQSLIETYVGTVNLTYLLYDEPDEVAETVEVMKALDRKTVEFSAMSDAEIFISWEDSSTTNYSPDIYRKYIGSEISEWCDILHNSGKHYVQHACGHVKDLLPIMAENGVDGVESISPYPTGNVSPEDMARLIPGSVGLIGGIEPTDILNRPDEEVVDIAERLLDLFRNRPFVLANSDSCPPGVSYSKFKILSDIVKNK